MFKKGDLVRRIGPNPPTSRWDQIQEKHGYIWWVTHYEANSDMRNGGGASLWVKSLATGAHHNGYAELFEKAPDHD